MANTVSNVSTGKPKIAGAIYAAPVGSTLPTTADATLDNAFVALGYVSEDGLSNDNSMETQNIRAWGGDVVLTPTTSRDDTFTYTLIEALNVDVLKHVYGSANVTGTLATGITVTANNKQMENTALVIDMIMREGALKRIVIPSGAVTAVGTIEYKDDSAVGYQTTLTCNADSAGNTHYEYIKKSA